MLMITGALLGTTLLVPATAAAEPAQPNIVVLMTDDMRTDDLDHMPYTRSLLGQLNLTDFVSNHPLCCPARAEILTGQFGHNNGVHHNKGPWGQYQSLLDNDNTLPVWMQQAGYETSFAGKFMNGYSPRRTARPAGFDRFTTPWTAPALSEDPTLWRHDDVKVQYDGHISDAITDETTRHIQEAALSGNPFFHMAYYTAPHASMVRTPDGSEYVDYPVPAARHADLFKGVRAPAHGTPAFTNPDGHSVHFNHRKRLQSLQSVDEGVRDIVQITKDNGTFANTVFIFTSDNGFLLGEHGLWGKNHLYEESLRVPFLATGPGLPAMSSGKSAMLTDLPTSIAGLGGATPGRPQDGRDHLFSAAEGWTEGLLIQAGSLTDPWGWRGWRDNRWTYVRWADGFEELYDRQADPMQMANLSGQQLEIEERFRDLTPSEGLASPKGPRPDAAPEPVAEPAAAPAALIKVKPCRRDARKVVTVLDNTRSKEPITFITKTKVVGKRLQMLTEVMNGDTKRLVTLAEERTRITVHVSGKKVLAKATAGGC